MRPTMFLSWEQHVVHLRGEGPFTHSDETRGYRWVHEVVFRYRAEALQPVERGKSLFSNWTRFYLANTRVSIMQLNEPESLPPPVIF